VLSVAAASCVLPVIPLIAQKPNTKPASAKLAAESSQGHYYRLKLDKIMDEQGFGQPVEVASLLPADWRTEGGVRWDGSELRCPINIIKLQIIKLQFRAAAPDGLTGIEL